MRLLREIVSRRLEKIDEPAVPEDGWNVGLLGPHGVILSTDGFVVKLDGDQLNAFFDLVEDGEDGEILDHAGNVIYVEVGDEIVLSRAHDKVYPDGVVLDEKTLKELGVERDDALPVTNAESREQPAKEDSTLDGDDTIEPDKVDEGVKKAFRRVGKKIKRGWRVTSGFRKGRVVSSPKAAFKPRAKAKTRMKLKIAAKRKKIVRIMKSKITRRKPLSKRLVNMNKRAAGKK
jgi:hypothetical protein